MAHWQDLLPHCIALLPTPPRRLLFPPDSRSSSTDTHASADADAVTLLPTAKRLFSVAMA
jgi:hypothetical protein